MSRFYRDTRLIENSVQKESTVPETKERPPKFSYMVTRKLSLVSSGALSIQQKFRFEISETLSAQWNGTFRLHRLDPSHRAFCYCGFAAHS